MAVRDLAYALAVIGVLTSGAVAQLPESSDGNAQQHPVDALESTHGTVLAVESLGKVVMPGIAGSRPGATVPPGLECRVTCNGDVLPFDPDARIAQAECWGKFSTECTVAIGGWNVTNELRCHGALMAVHGVIPDIPDIPDGGVTLDQIQCEGGVFTMTELKKVADTDEAVDDGVASFEKSCPSGDCVSGFACAAKSTILTKQKESFSESEVHCEEIMLAAQVAKTAEEGASTARPRGRRGGERQGHRGRHATPAEHVRALLSDPQAASGGLFEAAMDGAASWSKVGPAAASRPRMEAHTLTAEAFAGGSGGVWGAEREPADEDDAREMAGDIDCKCTCNGKQLPLHGWWPCGGATEFKCSGEAKEGFKYSTEVSCHGVSMPAMMSCKGLTRQHSTFEEPGEFKMETMEVSSGLKRLTIVEEAGWKGGVAFGKGFNSVRVKWRKLNAEERSKHEKVAKDTGLSLGVDVNGQISATSY